MNIEFEVVSSDQWDVLLLRIPELSVRDRRNFEAVLHVLLTGLAWEDFPAEEWGMSSRTPWSRYRAWRKAGLWSGMVQVFAGTLPLEQQQAWLTRLHHAETLRQQHAGSRKRAVSR